MNTRTLAERIAEGRIPAADALRYAMQIAEALRRMHDEGRVHGSVSPISIGLDHNAAELIPAVVAKGAVTPYTAPEVVAGSDPDARSDIFSLGAVVYEMLTGRHAFEGTDRSAPAPSGSPAVDRFVGGCLAGDPQARLQNMKRVIMELKLLHGAARRAETPSGRSAAESAVRTEVQKLEDRMTSRLQEQQRFVTDMHHAVTEAVATLRGQLSTVSSELESSRERSGEVQHAIEAASERIIGLVKENVDAVSGHVASVQLSVDAASVRIAGVEQGLLTANSRLEEIERKPEPVL
ncbi:MAG TPA: hypothetical protein VML19_33710, partial [Verrucomicrobiae bacterium]|nr:hypothetical protein [Verrucomicrobiae bacterium]